MCDFSFVTITYNHENFILEHLESIIYQIKNFGDNKKYQLIVSDDCSTDKTVELVKRWLDKRESFFDNIQLIDRKKNVGLVRNLHGTFEKICSDRMKLLAGDDIYGCNNIFELIGSDFIITPVIRYDGSIIDKKCSQIYKRLISLNSGNSKEKIRKLLRHGQFIPSPGVFASKKLFTDQEVWDYVLKYKYIEDIPLWHYIFNYYESPFKIEIAPKPYIIYRINSGSSKKIAHKDDSPISAEHTRMRRDIKIKGEGIPKFINPYNYTKKLRDTYIDLVLSKTNEPIKSYISSYENECDRATKYLEDLHNIINQL